MTSNETLICPKCGAPFPREHDPSASVLDAGESRSDPRAISISSSFELPAARTPDPVLLDLGTTKTTPHHESSAESSGSRSSAGSHTDIQTVDPAGRAGHSTIEAAPEAAPRRSYRVERPAPTSSSADEEEELADSPLNFWVIALLGSYASAVTLALLWFVVLPKLRGKGSATESSPVVSAKAESGLRADRSRKIEPHTPLPADHRTTIGKPLVMGSLEITPIAVKRGSITLLRNRIVGGTERREGTENCLILQFRLRNVSDNLIFAPYDESFVRDREQGIADSFVEFAPNLRVYPYPLARESEWSIEGQSFRELKPGETMETIFVSSPDGEHLEGKSLLWRLRLRTGLDSTDLIGITTDVPKS